MPPYPIISSHMIQPHIPTTLRHLL
jgi:hypothetical protein